MVSQNQKPTYIVHVGSRLRAHATTGVQATQPCCPIAAVRHDRARLFLIRNSRVKQSRVPGEALVSRRSGSKAVKVSDGVQSACQDQRAFFVWLSQHASTQGKRLYCSFFAWVGDSEVFLFERRRILMMHVDS